jgi:hypothetical protein
MNLYTESKLSVMKKALVSFTILAMLAMSSCLVSSLHPFYKSKDKIYEPAMVGAWIDEDSCIWTIETNTFMGPDSSDYSYRITYYEDEGMIGLFTGTLFQLNGDNYVDFYPDPDEDHHYSDFISFHHFPTHTLARVSMGSDSIMLYWYGEEWLTELFEQNRIRIKHETVELGSDYSRHVLTAPTDELQKFITKYANSPKTGIDVDQIFARGYTSGKDEREDTGAFLKLKPYNGPLPENKAIQVEPNVN